MKLLLLSFIINIFFAEDSTDYEQEAVKQTVENIEDQIKNVDQNIKQGIESIKSSSNLPLLDSLNNHPPTVNDIMDKIPDASETQINKLSSEKVNDMIEKIKELPEGKLPSQVENLLSNPELQDPNKLKDKLKNMKIGPLSSLSASFSQTDTKKLVDETWGEKKIPSDAIKIVKNIINNKLKDAADSRVSYSETMKKILSPEAVANMFGQDLFKMNNDKTELTDAHIKSLTYELTQKGYSEDQIDLLIKHLESTMNVAMESVSKERFDYAAEALIKYQETIKQFQIEEIYNLNQLNIEEVKKLADRIKEPNLAHNRYLEAEKHADRSNVKEHILSGDKAKATASANSMISSAIAQSSINMSNALAAKLRITDPAIKKRILNEIQNNKEFQNLSTYYAQACHKSLLAAMQHAQNGEKELAAAKIAEAIQHLSNINDPIHVDNIHDSIITSIMSVEPTQKEETANIKTAENTKTESKTFKTLSTLDFTPPKKKVELNETTSEVIRNNFLNSENQAEYSMHEGTFAGEMAEAVASREKEIGALNEISVTRADIAARELVASQMKKEHEPTELEKLKDEAIKRRRAEKAQLQSDLIKHSIKIASGNNENTEIISITDSITKNNKPGYKDGKNEGNNLEKPAKNIHNISIGEKIRPQLITNISNTSMLLEAPATKENQTTTADIPAKLDVNNEIKNYYDKKEAIKEHSKMESDKIFEKLQKMRAEKIMQSRNYERPIERAPRIVRESARGGAGLPMSLYRKAVSQPHLRAAIHNVRIHPAGKNNSSL